MADELATKLAATQIKYARHSLDIFNCHWYENSDNASPDNWKAGLNIPAKDTRQQTEVLKHSVV